LVPAIVGTSNWIQGLVETPLAVSDTKAPGNGDDERQTVAGNTAKLPSNKGPEKGPSKESFNQPKSEEEHPMFDSRLV
jgi:hypothetical protein